jgi:anti-sigma B factor antagonist
LNRARSWASVADVEIKLRKVKSVTILDLEGALLVGDPERDLRDRMNEAVGAGARRVAVNLADVPYMDSSGIGALIRISNSVRQAGGRCQFYAATKKVRQLLKMVRLDTVLDLFEDEDSALAAP